MSLLTLNCPASVKASNHIKHEGRGIQLVCFCNHVVLKLLDY